MSLIASSGPGWRSYPAPEPTREILPDTHARSDPVPSTRPGFSILMKHHILMKLLNPILSLAHVIVDVSTIKV